MAEKNKIAEKSGEILSALQDRYPVASTQLAFANAWQLLVATQLSAQCTDARVNEVTPRFFELWPTPQGLITATREEIEEVIRPTGFFHNKAKNLLACANMLVEKYDGQVPSTMEELIKLPGVARKTANVILFGAFGKNYGIAVDTHVKRITWRLGLTSNNEPVKVEKDLMAIFPREEWGNLNLRMVRFGRDVCKARKPQCSGCEFADFCPKNKSSELNRPSHDNESPAQ